MEDGLKRDRNELTTKVIAAIAGMLKKPPETISLDSKFDELGIVVPDEDARQIATVRDVIDRVGVLLESPT